MSVLALEIENVSAFYQNVKVLDQLNFTVTDGHVFCILGRNGVGKTTFIRSLMGLHKKISGKILLFGKEITALAPYDRVVAGLGLVPQGREIFPRLTVEENINITFQKDKPVIEKCYHYFPVLKEMRKRLGGNLSGGQQQQLAIARALATQPKVLLLDEPTEGVQPNIIEHIGQILLKISSEEKITIVLVEQYLEFIRQIGNEFIILNKGRIAAQGNTQQIDNKLIENYLTV